MGSVVSGLKRKWQVRSQDSSSDIDSSSYVEVYSFTSKPLKGGTYKVSWFLEGLRNTPGGGSSNLRVRFLIDGVEVGTDLLILLDDEWQSTSGWIFIDFEDGDTPVLSVEGRIVSASATLSVRRVKYALEFKEI